MSKDLLEPWAALFDLRTILVPAPTGGIELTRDPKDVPFLACAITNAADFLITGDKDLLEAKLSILTHIVTVAEFASVCSIAGRG